MAHLLKVEALKEKEEAERRVEEEWQAKEKRKENEWLQLEAEEREKELALERERQEATEHQHLADLKEKEEAREHKQLKDLEAKEKEEKEREKGKADEANELALQVAGAPLASDGNTEVDPVDPKTVAMAELRNRRAITEGKKRAHSAGSQKRKVRSRSLVDDSEVEGGDASAGPSMPKQLKTEPVPQAKDKVFTGNGAWCHRCSMVFVDFIFFRALWKVPGR